MKYCTCEGRLKGHAGVAGLGQLFALGISLGFINKNKKYEHLKVIGTQSHRPKKFSECKLQMQTDSDKGQRISIADSAPYVLSIEKKL